VTLRLTGCVVIEGAPAPAFTESVAALLAILPTELLTSTMNRAPLSEVAVAGVV
jgi:hypothetical protein